MLDERAAQRDHTPEPRGDFREVLRALRPIVGQRAIDAAGTALALERFHSPLDPPSIASCTPLEAPGSRTITPASEAGVAAFLDGVQRSRIVGWMNGSPLVHGAVAAVVRRRESRQLVTWGTPLIRHRLFAARPLVGEAGWERLARTGLPLEDLSEGETLTPHPVAVRGRALERIAGEREQAERQLAAAWCRDQREWLWIDGGIAGNVAVDERACAFGVVKSHTTLYGDSDALATTLALRAGERSAAFLVGHRPRRAVASWYLRLRDSHDGDPLHALVRVETAPFADERAHRFTEHADRLSSWILAERMPLSRPDPRWDTLTYGVHGCEAYLKSILD